MTGHFRTFYPPTIQRSDHGTETHLQECLETNEQGQVELKLKLPNQSALDSIAAALAKLTVLSVDHRRIQRIFYKSAFYP